MFNTDLPTSVAALRACLRHEYDPGVTVWPARSSLMSTVSAMCGVVRTVAVYVMPDHGGAVQPRPVLYTSEHPFISALLDDDASGTLGTVDGRVTIDAARATVLGDAYATALCCDVEFTARGLTLHEVGGDVHSEVYRAALRRPDGPATLYGVERDGLQVRVGVLDDPDAHGAWLAIQDAHGANDPPPFTLSTPLRPAWRALETLRRDLAPWPRMTLDDPRVRALPDAADVTWG